jgi:hypothetical protein
MKPEAMRDLEPPPPPPCVYGSGTRELGNEDKKMDRNMSKEIPAVRATRQTEEQNET